MANFIAIPLKKTSEIDLVKPLKNVFSSFCVAADQPVNYDEALNELNKLRMNSTWRTLDKHENSLDVMTRYYDQLHFLDAKCPAVEFNIPFKWKDAFDKGSFFMGSASLTLQTLGYEKICILFNIGAMQSQVACSHISDTKNDEGLKLAAKYFQLASGTFQHLKTLACPPIVDEPTPDLRPDTISALQALMLAQAQESFFFKATAGNMKDAVVAKVASRAEELYSDALKLMQKESVVHLWERDWVSIVAGKQAGFLSLAEYYQSLVCKSKKEVGEEIARLQKAIDAMKSAESKGILTSDFKDYLPRMTHNYDEVKKDNDFIYHARIPDAKSLPPIGKAALAKHLPPGDKLNPNSEDMFSALLPIAVQQAVSAFDLRKMEIVNREKERMQSETQMLNGILASLNLPAALEDTSGNALPQSLKDKAQAVKDKGGMEVIQQLLNELPSLHQRNNEILAECERMLKDEEDSDTELRSKFGSQWVRTPSAKLNAPLKNNLTKYAQMVSTAHSADGIVKEKYEKHKDKIALLCLPEDQLTNDLPAGSPVASCPSVDRLKSLMRDVESLKSEREMLMSELESPAVDMKAKFLSALSSEGNVNEQALSAETLGQVYGPLQKSIQDNISKQEQIVKEIQVAHNEFSKEKNNSSSANKREALLCELAAAHDAYMELLGNLQEGSQFYNNLTEILVNFQNKISDFCFARKTEKEEVVKDLQKNIVSVASQPSPLAPPAHHNANQKPVRPPPPKVGDSATAPPPHNWNYPVTSTDSQQAAQHQQQQQPQQQQTAYPPYPAYAYPYPPVPNPYNPYGQIVMPPFPPAPGYQGQPMQPTYPGGYQYPQQQQQPPAQNYPYPQQQYRPWQQ
ncbi:Programmed cell death 6-interacting protein [Araneus ventricosus]|uniref:Programmed cell death 6-interacting protein n=1 Tax=Araneus ventricosus TaxID=182803 RepID=A0A4Y2DIV5_ARAVE|nr:Programmed cell death 6-interacting protein [Araneus ventricosus]